MKFRFGPKEKREGSEGKEVLEDEKVVGARPVELETLGHGDMPPDPDAHLSEEERARVVCSSLDEVSPVVAWVA